MIEPVITYDFDEEESCLEIFVDLVCVSSIYCENEIPIEAYVEAFKDAFMAGFHYHKNKSEDRAKLKKQKAATAYCLRFIEMSLGEKVTVDGYKHFLDKVGELEA